ncbi:uncharacterized protein BT62DRAFT_916745 [Guyanagaster necrorhizus]|uniref:Copper acquisition factor BIM1-like domain-containing protein n=1 Tax=Guyanagaster necrorhizus TaxID=856835 RepID=A0A9P7W156_9AGAR|nr:uncharacterized protein BT62DRAFT_916745 [Guyanagaster necrorhizus MCA 3950]KAG7450282.1 hypothetical protein BT62DRAFT_916745 [Guyanagaster necrorhizus MCA 3950]
MKFLLLAAAFALAANAHFQLQFPDPRGAFNEDNEPTFCDGYTSVAQNRTDFPLDSGFFSLNSEHPQWTAAVYLSTSSNPTSFDDFEQIVPFFELKGEGLFCLSLNLSSTNATGLTSGQNVTLQFLYNGGDDQLYQCSDLTLLGNFSLSQSIDATCTNSTNSTNSTSSGSSSSSGSDPLASSLSLSGLIVWVVGTMAFLFM